jgi:neutral amino acid transport system permease protein
MNTFAALDVSKLFGDAIRAGIGVNGAVFALAAVGLNLHYGFTGLLNFGMVAFMAAGSYGMAILFTQGWLGGSILLGIAAGITFAIALAMMVGLPALRLRADYLAITTIAIGEVLRISFRSQRLFGLTGGPFGLPSIEDRNAGVSLSAQIGRDWNPLFDASEPGRTYGFWRLVFDAKTLWVMIIGWTLVVLMTLLIWALIQSPWGRVLKAIREDEDAARAMGKNVYAYKLQSLAIGGIIGALAGIVRTLDTGFVQSEQFRPQTTFFIWTVLILGGAASKWGPALGAIVFWFVLVFAEELLRQLVVNDWIPDFILDSSNVAAVRLVLMGVALIALMVWRPQGLLGKKEEVLIDAR